MSDNSNPKIENLDLTLLANFVHQVVNPLNGVAGTLDNLVDGTIGASRREQRTKAARAQLERCITLLRNLAFLVSDPTSISASDLRTAVLPQVIIESAMFFQEEGASRKISINLKDRATQNRVSGHPELIRQVLMNIFGNCIKYSRFGSEIEVNQWVQKKSMNAMITVRSLPAVSIAIDEIQRFFDLGFRGSNAKAVVASGTGLGLYICRQLIEGRHGGEIYLQNDKDGLLFTIMIPHGEEG